MVIATSCWAKEMPAIWKSSAPRCGTLNHLRDMIPGSEPPDGQNGAFYADSEKEIGN